MIALAFSAFLGIWIDEVPPKMWDWMFIDAQEQFVLATVPPKERKATVPQPIARCFTRMGSKYYKVRDRAKNDLRMMGPDIARWMFWCEAWKDPEIAMRCGSLLHEFSRCGECKGSGEIVNEGATLTWSVRCRTCAAFGHFWIPELLSDNWNR